MALDPQLNVLLVVTGSLQLGALATRIGGRKHAALAMAGANAALALALTLLISYGVLANTEKIDAATAVFVALEAVPAGAAAIGLASAATHSSLPNALSPSPEKNRHTPLRVIVAGGQPLSKVTKTIDCGSADGSGSELQEAAVTQGRLLPRTAGNEPRYQ